MPVSVSCPDYANDHRVSPFGSCLKGMHFLKKIRMTLTWTGNVEKTSCHDRHVPLTARNE